MIDGDLLRLRELRDSLEWFTETCAHPKDSLSGYRVQLQQTRQLVQMTIDRALRDRNRK